MAVNVQGEVSTKENAIATARTDPLWDAMTVDEIHARVLGDAAIASGFISAHGKSSDGKAFSAKVRFLAALVRRNGAWQLVGTQSAPLKQRSTSRIEPAKIAQFAKEPYEGCIRE